MPDTPSKTKVSQWGSARKSNPTKARLARGLEPAKACPPKQRRAPVRESLVVLKRNYRPGSPLRSASSQYTRLVVLNRNDPAAAKTNCLVVLKRILFSQQRANCLVVSKRNFSSLGTPRGRGGQLCLVVLKVLFQMNLLTDIFRLHCRGFYLAHQLPRF